MSMKPNHHYPAKSNSVFFFLTDTDEQGKFVWTGYTVFKIPEMVPMTCNYCRYSIPNEKIKFR